MHAHAGACCYLIVVAYFYVDAQVHAECASSYADSIRDRSTVDCLKFVLYFVNDSFKLFTMTNTVVCLVCINLFQLDLESIVHSLF